MYNFFTTVLNMSITAGILALAVIILRFLMKRVPKRYICILWALVALRLLFPFSISSPLSAYNLVHSETDTKGQIEFFGYSETQEAPVIEYRAPQPRMETASPADTNIETRRPNLHITPIVYVWLGGMVLMLAYALSSYIILKRKVRVSKKYEKNIFVCDEINTPFILGFIKPRIYLPTGLTEEVKSNVIAHELSHIKRLDYLWKPFGFVLLSIHWFNPVLWVAYVLLCKDIEGACDERVIAGMDRERVILYSEALLSCASQRRMITACPVAFGETDVKGRIKNVLNYRKPAFWIILMAVVACLVVAVCFLTNPKGKEQEVSRQEQYAEYLSDTFDDFKLVVNGEEITSLGEESITEGDVPLRSYKKLDDGTWECDGYVYKYRLEVTGRMPGSAYDSKFTFLSNLKDIPFEQAWRAAGYSSNTDDYFSPEKAVCIGWEKLTQLSVSADYPPVSDPVLKQKILSDYEEAYGYRMWFSGAAPMNYDYTKEEDTCTYVGFDYPGVTTMDDLTKLLKTRFTDEIILTELGSEFFKEYDGRLYVMDAARGSDISIDHVDYEVYYDSDSNKGEIIALIYRQDFDEETYEPYLTGVVDQKHILFTMEEDGAVFNTFPTIW